MNFTVLMSIYKNEKIERFHEAIKSVWDDQILKPNEIVLVKDGPLSPDLDLAINSWQDKLSSLLKIVHLSENSGLAVALNEGLKHCTHELVARMDTDDISLPHRFSRQIEFMRNHPETSVSSAFIEEFDEQEGVFSVRKLSCEHDDILKFAKTRCPISHPVAIFKKSVVLGVGGYPVFKKAEDVGLWSMLLQKGYKFGNIDEVLLRMRIGREFFTRRGWEKLQGELDILRFQKRIGFINWPHFLKNMAILSFVRLSPPIVKKILYKYARR